MRSSISTSAAAARIRAACLKEHPACGAKIAAVATATAAPLRTFSTTRARAAPPTTQNSPTARRPARVASSSLIDAQNSRWLSQSSSPTGAPCSDEQAPRSSKATSLLYYDLFPQTLPHGPPPAGPFHIDVRALRREFLRLQAAAHPDFHHGAAVSGAPSGGSQQHQEQAARRARAEAASATINAAYRTLADPLLRAQYLLREQHGVDLAGDEAGRVAAAEPALLAAVMDARESIEEAVDEAELEGVRAENEVRAAAAVEALARAFAEGDVEAAKREAVRLRYWENIRESVNAWESGRPIVLQH